MITQNKKGAMEMSVGTIVTIVLLMSVLVLGIFMIQKIFSGSNDAIDSVNDQVSSEITKLFSESQEDLILYPQSGRVTVKKGNVPSGAAFSYKNPELESKTFVWTVEALESYGYMEKCGSTMSKKVADSYLELPGDRFQAKASGLSTPQKIFFEVPEQLKVSKRSFF